MDETPKIKDQYDSEKEYQEVLDDAERNAETEWEVQFIEDMKAKFERFGMEAYLTNNMKDHLERLANK